MVVQEISVDQNECALMKRRTNPTVFFDPTNHVVTSTWLLQPSAARRGWRSRKVPVQGEAKRPPYWHVLVR
jgi:hypothetical protein